MFLFTRENNSFAGKSTVSSLLNNKIFNKQISVEIQLPSNIMVDHFTKLWLLVSWRFLKLQGKPRLTDGTCLFYSDDTFYRYISVENFLHNISVSVACGKLIAARYTARHRRQGILQAIQARLSWWTLTFHSSLFHLHFRLFALQWSALS